MSEVFDGTVEVQDSSGNGALLLNGDLRQIVVFDAAGTGRIFLDGEANIVTRDAALHPVIGLYATGEVIISRVLGADNITVLRFLAAQASLSIGGESSSGTVNLRNNDGDDAMVFDGREGDVTVRHNIGGTLRDVMTFEGATAALRIGSEDSGGEVFVRDSAGRDVLHLEGSRAAMFIGGQGNEGDLIVRDGEGRRVVHLGGERPWSTSAPRATRATSVCSTPMATCASISTAPPATSTYLAPTARRTSPCATPRRSSQARCW
jgi:hypothetical protein